LRGLTVGTKVDITRADTTPAIVTELLLLGSFATWQAIGDHDRSTLRLRPDPQGAQKGSSPPGMTVWLSR